MSRSGFITVDNHELDELCRNLAAFDDEATSTQFFSDLLADVANRVLTDLKKRTPVKTGNLKRHWDEDNPAGQLRARVTYKGDGYEITLVNTTEYADWVEKGHRSYNQFGGPYTVRNSRIRPQGVPEGQGGGDWVYGRFYVRNAENLWQNGKLDPLVQSEVTRWINRVYEGKE